MDSAKNVAVTAGYITEKAREEFFSVLDAADIDLKAFTDGFYRALCSAELKPILEILEYVKRETGVWLEITTQLIPGHNDNPLKIDALSEWIVNRLGPDVPLHFSAYHSDWKMHDVPGTPAATLVLARGIAKSVGLRHVYTGNVRDELGQSTYCHACGTCAIGRDWYEITSWVLDESGCCRSCGAQAFSKKDPARGGRGGCRSSWAETDQHWASFKLHEGPPRRRPHLGDGRRCRVK